MINPQTQTLLERFSQIDMFAEHQAILMGGTALAYHLKHRESFDLDICFPFAEKLPSMDFLETFEDVTSLEFDRAIIDTAINEGGDIHELMQRYIINGVKVDFVINPSSNIYESKILQNDTGTQLGTLRIASVESIFKLKVLLLLDRNKIRDLYDVVYMFKHCRFSGKDLLQTITHYRITYRPEHIIDLLKAKKEDPFDFEGIENGVMDLREYDKLKNELLNLIVR
ncbi:nucleotidyl transferase AbiEii/AbiGii toxin family protein [Sulfurovum sp. ST-21]|uniref:Nucleotidyl transferase AbiEii/AbiGii toxin family protein n=1 Tax=Sulfurovum indicum TaxID=2779528 RepID=A0A7M1S0W1_9BACT|nr:nucleotidyl transferase AbiEii/AbiGii toxin family protein [Sulfurovum indicum]QOR61125.1 nucleotidyl transferase AbiEii/AbiGii toxin family protein [Sulfurovum indicum]